jgi:hypothetical protein
MSRIVSFDGIKASIYRWKFNYMPFTGILELPNGKSFFLNRELDEEKMVVACSTEYFKKFTRAI